MITSVYIMNNNYSKWLTIAAYCYLLLVAAKPQGNQKVRAKEQLVQLYVQLLLNNQSLPMVSALKHSTVCCGRYKNSRLSALQYVSGPIEIKYAKINEVIKIA